jgi:multidrug efflux pump
MNLPKFSVSNPVLVNMTMIIIFIYGIISVYRIPKESMPQIEWGMFMITVIYPGVAPDEIESLIIKDIEDELSDVTDVDYISSTAYEGRAMIRVHLTENADLDKAWTNVSRELDKVRNLPEDASDPFMQNISIREMRSICAIAVEGESYSPSGIKKIGENIRDDLSKLPYVSRVELKGTKTREIRIQPDAGKMEFYSINYNDIETAVKSRNLNLPAGNITAGKSEVLVRTMGEFDTVERIGYTVLRAFPDGGLLRIRDIADVVDTYETMKVKTRLDGRESINLYLYQNADGNILDIVENIKAYLPRIAEDYPDVRARIVNDESKIVKSNISTLAQSAVLGIILVFITLLLFIGWRNAIFAAMGIPFTFLMTFWLMQYFDITINNLSLFALVLVLGMVVDDAIVVIENVHRNIEEGMSPKDAAVKGTLEVLWPVTAAVMTTIAAFMPLLMMEGGMGKFLSVYPKVVSIALFASLFEALFILPSHLADFSKKHDSKKAEGHFYKRIVNRYGSLLIGFLKHRYIAAFSVVTALILSFAAVAGGMVKFEFFPRTIPTTLSLRADTFSGTPLETTDSLAMAMEKYITGLPYQENLKSLNTNVGQQQERNIWNESTNYMDLRLDLIEADSLTVELGVIMADLRKKLNQMPEIVSYRISMGRTGPPTGDDVEVRILGDDLKKLSDLTERVKGILASVPGIKDIEDDMDPGKKELKVYPDYDKLAIYGIQVSEFAAFLRVSSVGRVISEFTETPYRHNIRLMLAEDQIDTADKMRNLVISSRTGKKVLVGDISRFELTSTTSRISRRDGKRTVTITAATGEYEEGGVKYNRTPDEASELLFGNKVKNIPGLLENFDRDNPGYKLEIGGMKAERDKSFNSLYAAFLVALLVIYMILGTQFKSYIKPVVVMITIPFAFIGVIIGLLVTNTPFSVLSMIAVVALSGIVVNDSIVFVDFIIKERDKGIDRWNSLINAGRTRLRPIILTTLTTIFGLMPMIISQSESVKMWKPMAVSISFGLGFATILTLLVLPVVYSFVDGISCKCRGTERMKFADALKIREEKGYDKK